MRRSAYSLDALGPAGDDPRVTVPEAQGGTGPGRADIAPVASIAAHRSPDGVMAGQAFAPYSRSHHH